MSEPFLIALRESLQASVLLALVLFSMPARTDALLRRILLGGCVLGLLLGFSAGAVPLLGRVLGSHEAWTFWRQLSEAVLFSGSIVLITRRLPDSRGLAAAGMFVLGFLLVFFESRSLGFIVHDLGVTTGRMFAAFGSAAGGLLIGTLPLAVLRSPLRRLPLDRAFTTASLLLSVGALQFWFGGLAELGGENIMASLQHGLQLFINEFMKSAQSALLLSDHPFLDVSFAGLARFLGSDRSALTITVLFLMAPPVLLLVSLYARPDPAVDRDVAAHERRRSIASFRQDLTLRSVPVLGAFLVLVVLLHAVNVSLNPLYDPEPVPVREIEGSDVIRIPIGGEAGGMEDRKLRKFVYYTGNKQVLFLAMMKPDGTVGVALDQCEICRPADWNKGARGYAQQGENLFCKYCVTPISANTLNTPGGCNPIPIPFAAQGNVIIINSKELAALFDKAEALERKGTHL